MSWQAIDDWLQRNGMITDQLDAAVADVYKTYAMCRRQYYPDFRRDKPPQRDVNMWRKFYTIMTDRGLDPHQVVIDMFGVYGPTVRVTQMYSEDGLKKIADRSGEMRLRAEQEIRFGITKLADYCKSGGYSGRDAIIALCDQLSPAMIYVMARHFGCDDIATVILKNAKSAWRSPAYHSVYKTRYPQYVK